MNYHNIKYVSVVFFILLIFIFFKIKHVKSDFDYNCVTQVVTLEVEKLPMISERNTSYSIDKVNRILLNWKSTKLSFSDAFLYDYYEYFKSCEDFLNNMSLHSYLTLDKSLILNRCKSFTNVEKAFAIQTQNTSNQNSEEKIANMYIGANNKIINLKDYNGDKIFKEGEKYYSYTYLNAILLRDKYFEKPEKRLYLTNAPIIDDGNDIPIHTFIRGGLINGICNSESKSMIVSFFPLYYNAEIFNNQSKEFLEKRNDILAYLIAHEMGHCCFDLDDEYTYKNDIMYPVHKFEYLKWIEKLQTKN